MKFLIQKSDDTEGSEVKSPLPQKTTNMKNGDRID